MVELIETQLAAITAANLVKASHLNLNTGLRSGEVTRLNETSKYITLINKIGRASRELELARKKVAYNLANADDGFKTGNSDWLILSLHRAENALKGVTEQAKAIKAAVEEGHAL
jgi:UDP-N-acetylglucosamine 2-epimerase